jgi:pimeloyl-ACP methyl ester carboxylesterase
VPPGAADQARRPAGAPVDEDALFLAAPAGFTSEFPTTHPVPYDRYIRLRSTATRIEATRRPRQATSENPTWSELGDLVGTIRSPMQIIVGEHDWLAEAAAHLHERVDGSRLSVIPGAPHNVYFETPAAYNEVVTSFLASIQAWV